MGQNRFGISFWLVGEITHFRTCLSGDWDVHYWGYDVDVDPWPYVETKITSGEPQFMNAKMHLLCLRRLF